jgi:hypothetical protein
VADGALLAAMVAINLVTPKSVAKQELLSNKPASAKRGRLLCRKTIKHSLCLSPSQSVLEDKVIILGNILGGNKEGGLSMEKKLELDFYCFVLCFPQSVPFSLDSPEIGYQVTAGEEENNPNWAGTQHTLPT